ncbi:class I SAM-dependent methyltransferase [Candidatus Pelagibacter sp.]|jgi:ubiquinone/menaquinone biosynthesis C-methylase UbiE|nr:class I SAM-dependent methyltransferase [Candidatus Pelagibacter sp.]
MLIAFFQRLKNEIRYLKNKSWTLDEMGEFWDNLEEYDDINSTIYPYKKRFSNSKELFDQCDLSNFFPKKCLDLQTRTGNGSIFWASIFPNLEFYISDFSFNFLKKSKKNLTEKNINFRDFHIKKFPLPFASELFEFTLSYETIEHISDYKFFFSELVRVTKKEGIIILTCPNVSWEIVHFIAAVFNINHSEGPHTFIKKKNIDALISNHNLKIINYNTTIFFPFNNKFSIKLDLLLDKYLPKIIKEKLFLRHSYILKKI